MEAVLSLLAISFGLLVVTVTVFKLAVYGTLDANRIAEIEAERDARRRAERLKHVDMTGYEFTQNGLRYSVDRSELLAEKTFVGKAEERSGSMYNTLVTADRLFCDKLLNQPFYLRFEWTDYYRRTPLKWHYSIFYERADLLDFVQTQFPDKLPEIMNRNFSYADFEPTDEEILRSLEGTGVETKAGGQAE